jgi:hypothetical protein
MLAIKHITHIYIPWGLLLTLAMFTCHVTTYTHTYSFLILKEYKQANYRGNLHLAKHN